MKKVIVLTLTLLSLLVPNQISCMEKVDSKKVDAEKKDHKGSVEKEQSKEKSSLELYEDYSLLIRKKAKLEAIKQFFTDHPHAINIQCAEDDGCTPLILALNSYYRDEDVVKLLKLLIELGADVNLKDDNGNAALKIAVTFRRFGGAIEALLKAPGIDINIRDGEEETVLMLAVNNSDLDLIKQLLRHGANRKLLNKEHQSAIDIAIKKGWFKGDPERKVQADPIIKILKPLPPELIGAAIKNDLSKIKEYLANDGYIDATTDAGKTLLMFATEKGNLDLMQLLVENKTNGWKTGADETPADHFRFNMALINAQDIAGFTAMHIAVRNSDYDAVRILMNRGGGILTKTNNGQTPLSLAILIGNPKMVHILLQRLDPEDPLVQEALKTEPINNADQIQKVIQDFKEGKLSDVFENEQKEDKKN